MVRIETAFSGFSVDDVPAAQRFYGETLGLDVEAILMEGFRRVDEWNLIEREVDNFDAVFLRNEEAVAHMGSDRLNREELAILDLVNGKNTVKDIVRHHGNVDGLIPDAVLMRLQERFSAE